jgi:hypothetical protein
VRQREALAAMLAAKNASTGTEVIAHAAPVRALSPA